MLALYKSVTSAIYQYFRYFSQGATHFVEEKKKKKTYVGANQSENAGHKESRN